MADPRAKHFAKLHRLRSSARRWTVAAIGLNAAALVLLPYQGIGVPDAMWAAVAAGSVAVAGWRWSDYREMAAVPPPDSIDPAQRTALAQQRIESLVGRWSAGGRAISE